MPEQVPPPPPGQGQLPPEQERLWAMLAHLLSFVAAYLFLGFVAPLIVLLVFGPRSAFVRANAVESLNFNLTWLLYGIIAVILAFVLIGFVILIVLGIAYVVLVIIDSPAFTGIGLESMNAASNHGVRRIAR